MVAVAASVCTNAPHGMRPTQPPTPRTSTERARRGARNTAPHVSFCFRGIKAATYNAHPRLTAAQCDLPAGPWRRSIAVRRTRLSLAITHSPQAGFTRSTSASSLFYFYLCKRVAEVSLAFRLCLPSHEGVYSINYTRNLVMMRTPRTCSFEPPLPGRREGAGDIYPGRRRATAASPFRFVPAANWPI